jgi:hypothetical protein
MNLATLFSWLSSGRRDEIEAPRRARDSAPGVHTPQVVNSHDITDPAEWNRSCHE